MMKEYKLKDIDPLDIDDVLSRIESSFNIRFAENELSYIKNFGELCDHITNKIQLVDANDCTSQQAFYKLRNTIAATTGIDNKTISPDSLLKDLLPRRNRHDLNREWEKRIGFKLNILRPPYWVIWTVLILLLASIVTLFIQWPIGLSGVVLSIAGFWIANKLGKELDVQTIGEVTENMIRENYLQSRRNPNTFNRQEVEKVLTDIFSKDLILNKSELTRDANFT